MGPHYSDQGLKELTCAGSSSAEQTVLLILVLRLLLLPLEVHGGLAPGILTAPESFQGIKATDILLWPKMPFLSDDHFPSLIVCFKSCYLCSSKHAFQVCLCWLTAVSCLAFHTKKQS